MEYTLTEEEKNMTLEELEQKFQDEFDALEAERQAFYGEEPELNVFPGDKLQSFNQKMWEFHNRKINKLELFKEYQFQLKEKKGNEQQ